MLLNRRNFSAICSSAIIKPAIALSQSATELPETRNLRLVRSSDAGAAELSDGYATQFRSTPDLRAMCADAEAMQSSLRWARATGRSFAVRSGGHCFEGFSQHNDMVIDVREARQIEIDADAGLVTIGSGVQVGPLLRQLAASGFTIPAGTHSNVGMAGHTLGGGFGYFVRRDGLLIDHLVSATMVTADGDIVDASQTSHPDLFWALRGGGGGQFGIVATMTFRIQRETRLHWINIVEPVDATRAAEILFLWQRWSVSSPRHLCTHLSISRRGESGFLIALKGLSDGARGDVLQELKLLMRRKKDLHPTRVRSGTMDAILPHMLPPAKMPHANLKSKSYLFSAPLDERGTLDFLKTLLSYPSATITTNFESLGGAMADVSAEETAFPHRDAILIVHLQGNAGLLNENETPINAAMIDMERVLAPRATGGVYVNYPDVSLADWGQRYWSQNLARLKAVKNAYDPDNVFDHTHSIARA